MKNRLNLGIAFVLCLVVAMPLTAVQQTAPLEDPTLSCKVLTEAGTVLPAGQTASISNLKRVPLRITLSDPHLSFERVRAAQTDGKEGRIEGAVEVAVNRIESNKKTPVPIKLILTGMGLSANTQYLHVFLEIPIDSARRRENIEAFIKRVKSDPRATEQQRKLLELYKDSEVATLEKLYMENSVGEYELSCKYPLPHQVGALREIRSNTIKIRVVFEGHFFDKPNYRQTTRRRE